MDVLTTPAAMHAWSRTRRHHGRRIGLVPTMGALHAGHISLVGIAAAGTDDVVVSIFVNPLQFDRAADFEAYPRPIDADAERCDEIGVAAVYAPTAAAMYPSGFQTHVEPGPLADLMEGAARPGHFRGVTTVVAKLFGAVSPDLAVFGEKDFQQLAVVRRMTCDLDLGIEIVGAPIVREDDGLAMSSRNVRLDAAQRAAAVCVPRALDAALAAAAAGGTPPPRWRRRPRSWPPNRRRAWSTSRCSTRTRCVPSIARPPARVHRSPCGSTMCASSTTSPCSSGDGQHAGSSVRIQPSSSSPMPGHVNSDS